MIRNVAGPEDITGVRTGRAAAAGLGTGGMQTKLEAARIAAGAGIPVLLTSAARVAEALATEGTAQPGTFFAADPRRTASRLFWLRHATRSRGSLVLDAGAVAAVVQRRASLLPAGVVEVRGTFDAGDPVELVDVHGHAVARGLVNYDADELPPLLGRSTRELPAEYRREVVHRDDVVIL
jgi:glutamate 5-kinase